MTKRNKDCATHAHAMTTETSETIPKKGSIRPNVARAMCSWGANCKYCVKNPQRSHTANLVRFVASLPLPPTSS